MEPVRKKRKSLLQTPIDETLEGNGDSDQSIHVVKGHIIPTGLNSPHLIQNIETKYHNSELSSTSHHSANDVGFEHGDEIDEVVGANVQGNQLMLFIRWKGKDQCSFVTAEVANARSPEKVIQFYQSRILFVFDSPQSETQTSGLPVLPQLLPAPSAPNLTYTHQRLPPPNSRPNIIDTQPSVMASLSNGNLERTLCIVQQPPKEAVYQRILKPFPTVLLTGPGGKLGDQLYVQSSMLRGDSEAELDFLDGKKIIQISTEYPAIFKKLKIVSTSQQQGTLFRLRFQLKKYVNNTMEDIPGACCISTPLEVFSHTQYLKKDTKALPEPSIKMIVPPSGPSAGGNQIVILGANFCNSPNLRVCFGREVITAEYHERGTILCKAPPRAQGPQGKTAPIHVSNNGQTFCQTTVVYTYDD